MTPTEAGTRPRVEGEREMEIFDATLEVLAEVGYDLLTMDAVATRAKASKATLYRRWKGKPELVVAAIMAHKGESAQPDTGTLRGDLLEAYCGSGGPSDPMAQVVLAAVVTAMTRDPEFAEVYRRDFIAPKIAASQVIYERARSRGELHPDTDLSILAPSLIAILMHRSFLLGEEITPALIARVLDEVVLPAAKAGPCTTSRTLHDVADPAHAHPLTSPPDTTARPTVGPL